MDRHNTAAKIILQQLSIKFNLIKQPTPYYTYSPETILENADHKIYWDRIIYTGKTILCNQPDITVIDKIEKHTYLINIAIPNDKTVVEKEEEKREKYTLLAMEVKEIWQQEKVTFIPLDTSVTGITSKNYTENLQKLGLPKYIHTNILKHPVILKTCSMVRKFLNL